jgi:hypothetical protein
MDRDSLTTARGDSETRLSERRFIGRYEVRRLLGAGGMGQVYLAYDPTLDREVAVKLIGGELDNAGARRRLVQEARAAGRLRHPNIVTIFDAGEHEGNPYIAMEYVGGQTIRSLIARRDALTLGRRLDLMAGACAGLAHAHRANVIHLDIKPDNLMVDAHGVLKVVDFGIARVLQNEALLTANVAGTLRYMSPEQVTAGALDRRSDVFSLGCSLYELVAYEPAFAGSAAEVIGRIASGPTPRLIDARPDVDSRLDALVSRAMALDPADRFDDLDELGAALRGLRLELEPETVSRGAPVLNPASPAVLIGSPPRALRRFAMGAVVAAISSIGFAAAWWMREPPARKVDQRLATADETTQPVTVAPPPPASPVAPAAARGTGLAAAQPAPAPAPTVAPPAAPAPQEEVWRRLARGDRAGVLELLRALELQDSDPRIAYEVVDAVRPTAQQARVGAGALRGSPAVRSADDSLARATSLVQDRRPIEALRALWQAMDIYAGAASFARMAPPPVESARPLTTREAPAQVRPPQPAVDAAPAASESEDVLAALRRYHQAYAARDAAAVQQMFPMLAPAQVEDLRRSFEATTAYEIELRQPRVEVSSNTALVRTLVARRIVPRVGRPVTSEVDTEFRLQRDARGWLIVGVTANP